MHCLNCKSDKVGILKPESGDKYMLTEVDSKNNAINVANGLIVDVLACTSCGYIHLMNENIKNASISQIQQ